MFPESISRTETLLVLLYLPNYDFKGPLPPTSLAMISRSLFFCGKTFENEGLKLVMMMMKRIQTWEGAF